MSIVKKRFFKVLLNLNADYTGRFIFKVGRYRVARQFLSNHNFLNRVYPLNLEDIMIRNRQLPRHAGGRHLIARRAFRRGLGYGPGSAKTFAKYFHKLFKGFSRNRQDSIVRSIVCRLDYFFYNLKVFDQLSEAQQYIGYFGVLINGSSVFNYRRVLQPLDVVSVACEHRFVFKQRFLSALFPGPLVDRLKQNKPGNGYNRIIRVLGLELPNTSLTPSYGGAWVAVTSGLLDRYRKVRAPRRAGSSIGPFVGGAWFKTIKWFFGFRGWAERRQFFLFTGLVRSKRIRRLLRRMTNARKRLGRLRLSRVCRVLSEVFFFRYCRRYWHNKTNKAWVGKYFSIHPDIRLFYPKFNLSLVQYLPFNRWGLGSPGSDGGSFRGRFPAQLVVRSGYRGRVLLGLAYHWELIYPLYTRWLSHWRRNRVQRGRSCIFDYKFRCPVARVQTRLSPVTDSFDPRLGRLPRVPGLFFPHFLPRFVEPSLRRFEFLIRELPLSTKDLRLPYRLDNSKRDNLLFSLV
jgi:hypothetical protein